MVRRALFALLLVGCFPRSGTRGMEPYAPRVHDDVSVEVARVETRADRRPLLVVHPRTACSGSASTVLLDEDGTFFGAVPPGSAALLDIPSSTKTLTAISSVEINAAVATWTFSQKVHVPDLPSGLLFRAPRWNARDCGNGQYAEVFAATQTELETVIAENEIVWLAPRVDEGQAWIEAHRDRVDELLGVHRTGIPDVVARLKSR